MEPLHFELLALRIVEAHFEQFTSLIIIGGVLTIDSKIQLAHFVVRFVQVLDTLQYCLILCLG